MDMIDAKIFDENGKQIWPRLIRMRASPRVGEKITVAAPSRDDGPHVIKTFLVVEVAHKIYGTAPINDHQLELKVALVEEVFQPKHDEGRAG